VAILNFRRESGPFRRAEDLLAIKGISKGKLEELRPYVTVVTPPAPKSQ
jgi:DNA uptake protein ComE-like DNA-binding protein